MGIADWFNKLLGRGERKLSPEEIAALPSQWVPPDQRAKAPQEAEAERAWKQLHHWDVWGVAYLALDGCSEDYFASVLQWVMAQGPEAWNAILEDPQRLVEFLPEDLGEFPDSAGIGADVRGEPWDEDELEERFPRAAAWLEPAGECPVCGAAGSERCTLDGEVLWHFVHPERRNGPE